jgi:hypothetical protein
MKTRAAFTALTTLVLASPALAQWSLSPQPTVRIGSEASAEYQFNNIVNVKRLSDGRILVTTGPDIRFFDARGRFIAKAGGRGQGPGEFQYVSDLLVMPGDSLMAMNVRRFVVLDPHGRFVRKLDVDFKSLSTTEWVTSGEDAVLLPNGNLLAPQYPRQKGPMKEGTLLRPVTRYAVIDLRAATVTPLHTGGGLAQLMPAGQRTPVVEPFSPREQYAIGGHRVYVGDNDSTVIHAFDLDGKPLGRFTIATDAIPVASRELEWARQRSLEWATQMHLPAAVFEQRWAATPKPARHPYWGTALVDKTGALWVSAPPRTGETPVAWTTFDRDGKRLGAMTMPGGFTPKDIGADYVLGVQRDEDGVETVAMYSLRRK